MDLRSAVLAMISAVTGKWVVAAAHLAMTESALKNRAYETKGQSLSTSDALELQHLSGTTFFAEAIAQASGGAFVKLPQPGEIENESIQVLFNENYAELGKLFAAYAASSADGVIDAAERENLQRLAGQIHVKVQTLLGVIFSVYCPSSKSMRVPLREAA